MKYSIGQSVYDEVHHPGITGEVTEIRSNSITVAFGNQPGSWYYLDGRVYGSKYKPTLSLIPYTFERPIQPEFKKGDLVVANNGSISSYLGIYQEFKGGNLVLIGVSPDDNIITSYANCKKYISR